MHLKQLRLWLAGKILGGAIVEEVAPIVEAARHDWIKKQLAHGNPVTLEYEVRAVPIECGKKKALP